MAEEETGSWDAMVKRNALWLQSFWFVRGVMGTMALVALIPQVTELEQIEVLRALYALIIGWNEVMGWLGRVIGSLPFLPQFAAPTVTGFVFFVAIPLPGMIGSFQHPFISKKRSFYRSAFAVAMCMVVTLIYARTMHGGFDLALFTGGRVDLQDVIAVLVVFVFPLFLLRMAILYVPGYKAGLLFTVGVIASITIGYNIGSTDFSDWVNATVCAELNIAPADCSPD